MALYDTDSGRIRHLHTVHLHEGAADVAVEAAVAEAQRHARLLGHDVERLAVAVSNEPEHGSSRHRIDPATSRFLPLA